MISPSEFCYLNAIYLLIMGNREGTPAFSKNPCLPLQLLSFLADNITQDSCSVHESLNDFISYLLLHIPSGEEFCQLCRKAINCYCIDDVIEFMDNMDAEIFELPPNTSPNGSLGPVKLTKNSLLGLFVRSFSVRWRFLLFEDIALFYDKLVLFLTSTGHTSIEKEGRDSADLLGGLAVPEEALLWGDAARAEELVHEQYDAMDPEGVVEGEENGHNNPMTCSLAGNGGVNSAVEGSLKQHHHQYAMLSLATTWLRSGQLEHATVALDETMKSAHQCGDHGLVAQVLLLLHLLLCKSTTASAYLQMHQSADPEEILERCLERCMTLNLYSLASQAILLLIRFKSQRMYWASVKAALASDASEVPYFECTRSREGLWVMCATVSYDDISCAYSIARHGVAGAVSSLVLLGSGGKGAKHVGASRAMQAQGAGSQEASLIRRCITQSMEEYMKLYCQTGVLSMDVWCNVLESSGEALLSREIAMLHGRRVLRQLCRYIVSAKDHCSRFCGGDRHSVSSHSLPGETSLLLHNARSLLNEEYLSLCFRMIDLVNIQVRECRNQDSETVSNGRGESSRRIVYNTKGWDLQMCLESSITFSLPYHFQCRMLISRLNVFLSEGMRGDEWDFCAALTQDILLVMSTTRVYDSGVNRTMLMMYDQYTSYGDCVSRYEDGRAVVADASAASHISATTRGETVFTEQEIMSVKVLQLDILSHLVDDKDLAERRRMLCESF